MAKDISVGPSDCSLAGHLLPHQDERGPSRVPTEVQNMQPMNGVGAQQRSGRMKPCWCWQRKQHSERSGRNPGQSPFPGISVSFSSNLSLTSHICLDWISAELECPGSRKHCLVTKEPGAKPGAVSHEGGILQCQGEQGRSAETWITEHSCGPLWT